MWKTWSRPLPGSPDRQAALCFPLISFEFNSLSALTIAAPSHARTLNFNPVLAAQLTEPGLKCDIFKMYDRYKKNVRSINRMEFKFQIVNRIIFSKSATWTNAFILQNSVHPVRSIPEKLNSVHFFFEKVPRSFFSIINLQSTEALSGHSRKKEKENNC